MTAGIFHFPFSIFHSNGYPFTINTNLDRAVSLRIKSDVLLTNGVVRIALENATGDIKLHLPTWYDNESNWHDV